MRASVAEDAQGRGLGSDRLARRRAERGGQGLSWDTAPREAELETSPATIDQVDLVLGILDGAALWLEGRGIDQWHPGRYRPEQIAAAIRRGETFIGRREGVVVGTISLQWADELFWPGRPADAGYIHRLAVTPEAHGSGVGRSLIEWAAGMAGRKGLRFLRLDCAADNPRLCAYYESLGFAHRGEMKAPSRDGTWLAALYEKPLRSR